VQGRDMAEWCEEYDDNARQWQGACEGDSRATGRRRSTSPGTGTRPRPPTSGGSGSGGRPHPGRPAAKDYLDRALTRAKNRLAEAVRELARMRRLKAPAVLARLRVNVAGQQPVNNGSVHRLDCGGFCTPHASAEQPHSLATTGVDCN